MPVYGWSTKPLYYMVMLTQKPQVVGLHLYEVWKRQIQRQDYRVATVWNSEEEIMGSKYLTGSKLYAADDIVSDLDRSCGWLENAINELKGTN